MTQVKPKSTIAECVAMANAFAIINPHYHSFEKPVDALRRAVGLRHQARRTTVRCALPGCEATTTHNGGYCCADHCRAHRKLLGKNST